MWAVDLQGLKKAWPVGQAAYFCVRILEGKRNKGKRKPYVASQGQMYRVAHEMSSYY